MDCHHLTLCVVRAAGHCQACRSRRNGTRQYKDKGGCDSAPPGDARDKAAASTTPRVNSSLHRDLFHDQVQLTIDHTANLAAGLLDDLETQSDGVRALLNQEVSDCGLYSSIEGTHYSNQSDPSMHIHPHINLQLPPAIRPKVWRVYLRDPKARQVRNTQHNTASMAPTPAHVPHHSHMMLAGV